MKSQYIINKPDPAHGYYLVGESCYNNKTEAFYQASVQNKDPKWVFHDRVYNSIDWSIRPKGTLKELYKQRAEQIREKYDYVIVYFSGGTDSYYMLRAFLDNGIIPDEIFSFWDFEGTRKYAQPNCTDFTGANRHSEYEFAAKPVLEWVEKEFPQIKITTYDITQDIFNHELDEEKFLSSNHWLNIGSFSRYSARSDSEIEARSQGKSIGVAIGIDKILFKPDVDGNCYAWFLDSALCIPDNDPTRSIECFYWSPELPQIPILQAHELYTAFKSNPNYLKRLKEVENTIHYNQVYEYIYEEIIYPEYPKSFFQVYKATSTVFNHETDQWIVKYHHNERSVKAWIYTLGQYFTKIRKNLFVGKTGFVSIPSKKHFIGKIV